MEVVASWCRVTGPTCVMTVGVPVAVRESPDIGSIVAFE